MSKTLTEMAAEIVSAQAAHTPMSVEEITDALTKTFNALNEIRRSEDAPPAGAPAPMEEETDESSGFLAELRKNPMKSIQKHRVICLESGREFKQITNRHLREFGITTKEYRKKWGIPARQPLSAKALTATRRKNAQERNLGELLKNARAKRGKKGDK
jgi:predicted transcriptional regulator